MIKQLYIHKIIYKVTYRQKMSVKDLFNRTLSLKDPEWDAFSDEGFSLPELVIAESLQDAMSKVVSFGLKYHEPVEFKISEQGNVII